MNKIIKLRDFKGNYQYGEIKTLSKDHIDKIMELQEVIIDNLENKNLFARTERNEFENMINGNGQVIGVTTEKDELIAFGAMVIPGLEDFNLGYDLDFSKDKLLKVAHVESTVVHPMFRGNGIQKILCKSLEEVAMERGCEIFCATVAPDNEFSLRILLSLGYKIAIEKEKYGGLKRFIVIK